MKIVLKSVAEKRVILNGVYANRVGLQKNPAIIMVVGFLLLYIIAL